MGKKRKVQSLEELLERPWCYYCDRDFDDLKILHDHQKAKHFICQADRCWRRLNTVGGLRVHMQQVHKQELPSVPNAVEGRQDPNVEIFGTEGVPADALEAHNVAIIRDYRAVEQQHRALTGNPLRGTVVDTKKRKAETAEDLKARVRAARAAKAAAESGVGSNGGSPAPMAGAAPGAPAPSSYGHGSPPAVSYAGTPTALSSSPMPQGMPSAYAPPNGYGNSGYGNPSFGGSQGMPSSSPPPHLSRPPMSQLNNFPPGYPQPQGYPPSFQPQGLPPTGLQSFSPPAGFGGLPSHPGLPIQSRPTPLPQHTSIPSSKPTPDADTQTALDSLMDWASKKYSGTPVSATYNQDHPPNAGNGPQSSSRPLQAASSDESIHRKDPSVSDRPSAAAHQHEAVEGSSVSLEPRRVQAQGSKAAKADPRTKQLLTDNFISWEERKAKQARYQPKPKSTTMPTAVATQGATGSVEAGVQDS